MTYVGEDGQRHRPYMVHRALLGSLERFFGILVEHYAGAFPLWLAPEQARLLPVTENQLEAAKALRAELLEQGFRVGIETQSAGLGAKIRAARQMRIPYLLVVGEREAANGTMSVRSRRDGELGELTVAQIAERMQKEVADKTI